MLNDIPFVLEKLAWMKKRKIWPNGLRYLWTDAFGVVLLVSLYRETGRKRYLTEATQVVAEVERVLGRARGLRIGEASDRDGQYFHYLAIWLFALHRLGEVLPEYRKKGVDLARQIHPCFLLKGEGVWWKMRDDLTAPYPGAGLGAMDPYNGYVIYRLLGPQELSSEIEDMAELVESSYRTLRITQDLGLGMMLWLSHFFPDEPWARWQRQQSLAMLEELWVDPPGYFAREPGLVGLKYAFTNYGIALGLQSVGEESERVQKLNEFFAGYRSGDEYDREAITHVMSCTAHLPGEFVREIPASHHLLKSPPPRHRQTELR